MLAAALALATACAPPKASTPYPTVEPPVGEVAAPATVHYFERGVDLTPLLEGFPYEHFEASLRRDRLFFLETGEGYTLKQQGLSAGTGHLDLGEAVAVSDVDWSRRSLRELYLPTRGGTLWLHADERNDERMNLWTLDLRTKALAQVTDHDYVYGFGFSEDDTRIAYLPREGDAPGNYRTCLRILDVARGDKDKDKDKNRRSWEVVCDRPELSFTWSSPRFSPDGREVFFTALVDGDRNRKTIVSVDISDADSAGALAVVTDATPRSRLELIRGWIDDTRLLFIANDDGFANLYTYDRSTRQVQQVSRLREDVRSAAIIDAGVFAVSGTPSGSTISLIDPKAAKIVGQQRTDGRVRLIDGAGERVLWSKEAPDQLFEAQLATITKAADQGAPGLSTQTVIALPAELADATVHCRAEAVSIPTHDVDPATGNARQLHAFVLRPKLPMAAPDQQRALIKAFYGGGNRYSVFDQVMCAAGLTVISPAVRGSSGFGRDFAALNDRDLGGAEIRDLFAVGRWAEATLGLKSWQIGVFGGSHGGYATMRALTFEDTPDAYPFGFGLAHAGFSDAITFYRTTNIPDWVRLESGDPDVPADAERMRSRSPWRQIDRLRAPLLLTHGTQDARVPVTESRQVAADAVKLSKPVTYVEFEGQGHHIEGLGRRTKYFQANLDLLESAAVGSAPAPAPRTKTTTSTSTR